MQDKMSLVDLLSKNFLPQSLHRVCQTSLQLIENASEEQITTAVHYNQHRINVLLIQLLAVNSIAENQKQIQNDIDIENDIHTTDHDSNKIIKDNTVRDEHSHKQIQTYCERSLLSLSPMVGFSRKNYFAECNISDDVRMEIISYLKPIDLFQTISLINKQFYTNITTMHQSYKYSNIICNKNFVYQSFQDIENIFDNIFAYSWDEAHICIDWKMSNGRWVFGKLKSIYSRKLEACVCAIVDGIEYEEQVGSFQIAPVGRMIGKPASMNRFVNILKHGYFSETCDVNLRNFYFCVSKDTQQVAKLIGNYTYDEDIWRCGWIDFEWTWKEAIAKNESVFGVNFESVDYKNWNMQCHMDNSNYDCKNFPEISQFDTNKNGIKFHVFQIRVQVDITEAYKTHFGEAQWSLSQKKFFNLIRTENDEYLISLVFHTDDIDNITYFGHKTTLEEQLKIKKAAFNWYIASYSGGEMRESKGMLLQAVGYPDYCVLTPNGIFSGLSKDIKERKQFNHWFNIDKRTMVCENECHNIQISQNGINKVYYDRLKDELLIKIIPSFELILDDPTAPAPLATRYSIPLGSPCRLVEAKITDPQLIKKVKMENIQYPGEKEKRYFELLKEWRGFIQVSIDITREFDEFQQRLKRMFMANETEFKPDKKNDSDSNDDDDDKDSHGQLTEWDNRKYFLNDVNEGVPYLQYDEKEDKITHNIFILLDSKDVHHYHDRFNFFDAFQMMSNDQEFKILMNIFSFVSADVLSDYVDVAQLARVCKNWYRIHLCNQLP